MGKGRIRIEESIKLETDEEIYEAKLFGERDKEKEKEKEKENT